MNENQHTPGPWETDEQECMVFLPRRDKEGRRYAVACATDELTSTAGFLSAFQTGSHDEPHANMRLVAAAPDLLAALQAILAQRADGSKVSREEWTAATEAGRAAIKKALHP